MTSSTIDFFNVSPIVSEELVGQSEEYDLDDDDMAILRANIAQFRQQRDLSNKVFDEWLDETNKDFFGEVQSFIDKVLDSKKAKDFRDSDAELIHPAQVILGLKTTEHAITLNRLEGFINRKYKSIQVLRLRQTKIKRSNLLMMLDDYRDEPTVMVIVEETETFDKDMIATLIYKLHSLLNTSETERIILLFCISGSWLSIPNIISASSANRMKRVITIVKNPFEAMSELPGRLLRRNDMLPKISPSVFGIMDYNFMEIDASITNLRHMQQIMALHHYTKTSSILNLKPDKLTKILKDRPDLLEEFSELPSIVNSYAYRNIGWKNHAKVAEFCTNQIQLLNNNHRYLMNQIDMIFPVIEDETDFGFPDSPHAIYEELQDYDDLGSSARFIDAVNRIKTFPRDRLMKRLQKCIDTQHSVKVAKSTENVYAIAEKFLNKLENNDDYRKISNELVAALIYHAQFLRNPLRMPLNEAIYSIFRNAMALFQPSHRYHASRLYYDETTYFGRLFNLISNSPAVISLTDLYGEFLDSIKTDPVLEKPTKTQNEGNVRRKMTPRKSERSKVTESNSSPRKKLKPDCLDEGLCKAIFVDMIEAMEFQGFIKRDTRKSKRGVITRTAWLESRSK